MTTWLDPLSPAVRSAVISGAWGRAPHSDSAHPVPVPDAIDTIAAALETASDVLTRLTAFAIHPAVQVQEDYAAHDRVRRLTMSFSPVREVKAVQAIDGLGAALSMTHGWILHGQVLRFGNSACEGESGLLVGDGAYLTLGEWFVGWRPILVADPTSLIRVTYNVGSTVTASARAAVITLAHEYWVQASGCDECGECRLPDRTTSVSREGLQYTVQDPFDPLTVGATGLPDVDLWIKAVNPNRVQRRSGTYTPDSPPGVVRSVVTAREVFPAVTP